MSMALAILLVAMLTYLAAPHLGNQDETPACVRVTTVAGPADNEAIHALIDYASDINAFGLQTLDTTRYSTAYTNDPCVHLDAGRADYVRRIRTRFGIEAGMETDGWLAFKTAQIVDRRGGIDSEQIRRQTETAAVRAGLSTEPRDATRGQRPTPVPQAIATRKFPARFDAVYVDGDRAEAIYNPGGTLIHGFLVRMRVAGISPGSGSSRVPSNCS